MIWNAHRGEGGWESLVCGLPARLREREFWEATITAQGDDLDLTLAATSARLQLEHRDGALFTASLVAEGKFAAVADNLGPSPLGFAQFLAGADGTFDRLRLTMQDDGQAFDFVRE